jgi:glycosyltransferase involved in cell wall biosynthesis
MPNTAIFIVWKVYQRRVEALQSALQTSTVYFHYAWEEASKIHKALSYLCKFVHTLVVLYRCQPDLIYVQAPPTFAIYATWLYSRWYGVPYVVDAHNPMIYDSFWPKLPWATYVLRQAQRVIVHNTYVAARARELGLPAAALRVLIDRPAEVEPASFPFPKAIFGNRHPPRVVVPCSFDADEPLDDLQRVTHLLPDVTFFITWYYEKLPRDYVKSFGENTVFTGFLPLEAFNALLAHADVIVSLTTRDGTQPSVASEALAFQRPLVISDLPMVRELFPRGAIYVANDAAAMAAGIRTALHRQRDLEADMTAFKAEKVRLWEKQFATFKADLAGCAIPQRASARSRL